MVVKDGSEFYNLFNWQKINCHKYILLDISFLSNNLIFHLAFLFSFTTISFFQYWVEEAEKQIIRKLIKKDLSIKTNKQHPTPHASPLTWWYWLKGFVNPINPKLRKLSAPTVLILSTVQILVEQFNPYCNFRGNKLYGDRKEKLRIKKKR